jgi:hypothetical protein
MTSPRRFPDSCLLILSATALCACYLGALAAMFQQHWAQLKLIAPFLIAAIAFAAFVVSTYNPALVRVSSRAARRTLAGVRRRISAVFCA